MADARPDALVVVAYGEIMPPGVLRIPRVGPVSLHFSFLPRLRGASPVQTALLEGMTSTGVTTMLMDEGMDTGPILLQEEQPILADDDAGSLGRRLATAGAGLLVTTLDRLAGGTLEPRPQDENVATYAPKLTRGDRSLDWNRPAGELARRVRALSPRPGASTRFRSEVLKVMRAEAVSVAGEPGMVLAADRSGVLVAAAQGALRLLEVAPAGRKRMSGESFVHGYRPALGERLG